MRALIDTDILIYEAASICEVAIDWPYGDDDVLWTRHAHLDEAWARLNDSIDVLMEKVGADSCLLAITHTSNWRKNVLPSYKETREHGIKPLLVAKLRQMIAEDPRGKIMPTLEGDDILGIAATHPNNKGEQVIVSIDKDMKTIPGNHYDFRKDLFFTVEEDEANMWHLRQTLSGDKTDNYDGCPGIGEVKAEKLIPITVPNEYIVDVWENDVVPAFEDAGLDEFEATVQARVARILRYSDHASGKLWSPYE